MMQRRECVTLSAVADSLAMLMKKLPWPEDPPEGFHVIGTGQVR